MNVLALTCSGHTGSATLITTGLSETITWVSEKSHAEIVTLKIQELFQKTSLKPSDIDIYGVDVGPGSFTGIRIGCNTIKSLTYITGKLAQVFNSLEIIACGVPTTEKRLCVTVDAFADSVYLAVFENKASKWEYLVKPLVVGIDKLASYFESPTLHVGEGLTKYESKLEKKLKNRIIQKPQYKNIPSSEVISKLILENKSKISLVTWKEISPFYIKMSAAEEKLLV